MASFKLCISDPSTGKTFQREVKDNAASLFIGLNIGENIKGDSFEMSGYEFLITGGSDYCGFPMRKGILGLRKSLTVYGGVGFRGAAKGIKIRKTVCGHKIHERISQVNLKVVKQGSKKLAEIFGKEEKAEEKEAKPKEQKPESKEAEVKEHKKAEEKKEEKAAAKEHKEDKKEHKAEEKKEHKKHEEPKEAQEEKQQ
ncbi:30S ribosomal protein S6e [Candidatus Woesearchaeota archaeon]|nr:30S ribosomal protein S6e [Candidatus Woesearchaeota archaeon]